ncbi:hypothetical protein SAY87_000579 [Trapa incisa]|uniref:Fe2OG dioxygenase domain-containing protein n=1 Tax=Trapa incisa TaxID=236973 RepID=A0AAN7GMF2_9MYRT|nr:hypothetical protein SAY87_000579 [Trapa incisa]
MVPLAAVHLTATAPPMIKSAVHRSRKEHGKPHYRNHLTTIRSASSNSSSSASMEERTGGLCLDRREMSNLQSSWPEPIVRVQALSESGINSIPERYIKPPSDRPGKQISLPVPGATNIPMIDLMGVEGKAEEEAAVGEACREWGFFQVVNHGVSPELMRAAREGWRQFFHLPMEAKQPYANSPCTYEGYGSRLGVEKGAVLDWSDYFFLHYLPPSLRDEAKELIGEYSKQVVELGGRVMKVMSRNLGLQEDRLQRAFGGHDIGACLRVNFYPKCPQPDLTFGVSPHSDPGGLTLLLPDENVPGLQVRRGDSWITVEPIPDAFIINIGDQMEFVSNGIYKSIEHRVIVNSNKERVSLAYFYNPKSDIPIKPVDELVTEERAALYPTMTFDEYRLYIRTKGPRGKSQVDSLKSTK